MKTGQNKKLFFRGVEIHKSRNLRQIMATYTLWSTEFSTDNKLIPAPEPQCFKKIFNSEAVQEERG